jgi:Bacterial PH domain
MLATPAIAREGGLFHTRVEVSSRRLYIKADVFRKTIPMSDLQVSLARVVDLDQEPGLGPWIKIYGVSLPGYRSGWFRLRDRETALLVLKGTKRAVYIPTTRGYAVLLTPDRPAEFLAALQEPMVDGQVFSIAEML